MPILSVYVDDETNKRLQRAAEQLGREKIEDLAEAAVAETALSWAKENGFPGEDKPDMHPMKAGIVQVGDDLHKPHPIHDAIETESEGEQ